MAIKRAEALKLFSCKNDILPYSNDYERSKQTWNPYKATISDSYSYINYSSSVFGSYAETKIIVQNGKVTGRFYTRSVRSQNSGQLTVVETWTEDAVTLNTHSLGAGSFTLDEIYDIAKKEWLSKDLNKNDVYFSVDTMGLISSCGYVEKGCIDDCFRGINVKATTHIEVVSVRNCLHISIVSG